MCNAISTLKGITLGKKKKEWNKIYQNSSRLPLDSGIMSYYRLQQVNMLLFSFLFVLGTEPRAPAC